MPSAQSVTHCRLTELEPARATGRANVHGILHDGGYHHAVMLGQLSVLPANVRACAQDGQAQSPSYGCASRHFRPRVHPAALLPLLLVLLSHRLASAQQPSSPPATLLPGVAADPSANGNEGQGAPTGPLSPNTPVPPPPNLTWNVTDSAELEAALRELAAMGLDPLEPVRINLAAGTFLLTDPDPFEVTFNLNLVGSGSAELTRSSSSGSSSSGGGGTVVDCRGVDREAFIFTGAPFTVQVRYHRTYQNRGVGRVCRSPLCDPY